MVKVVVLDPVSPEGLKLLEAAGTIEYEVRTGLKGEDLRKTLAEFDGAICRSGVKITADALEGNKRLRVIVRAGVGTDNIDTAAATRQGIVVMNTPGGNTIATAEHTMALMLALSRNVFPAYKSLLEGKWERHQFVGTELCGKTLGLIGLGRVGQAVAERALAFKMRVLGYDPFLPEHRARELGVQMCHSIDEMLPEVDYLSVHTPLNDQTRNLIDRPQIQKMKKGVRLINCARGGIYNEEALLEGLQSGHIAGVALDVFTKEPCTASPLFGQPGVLCTPHLGASTEEAQTNVAIEACQLLVDFFTTGAVRNSVNMAPLDPKTLEGLRGFLDLTYRLGLLTAQLDREAPTRCRIRYQGEVANRDTRLLSAAFAAGLLQHALEQAVNLVNAPVLMKQRGIEMTEERTTDIGDFASQITVEVFRNDKSVVAGGTLFGKSLPRLIQKGPYRLESPLEGTMLIMYHRDVPGVIGRVGEICGRHNVNIAFLSLGRAENKPGGEAIGILALDNYPPAEAIGEILKLDPIHRAIVVSLPPRGELPSWLGVGLPQ